MKPPTEEQLNEEVDDGYGLHTRESPPWFIQGRTRPPQGGADALEMTSR
jgi:hypothetical protein